MTATLTRFWSKVNKTDGCWLWMGQRSASVQHPYGGFFVGSRTDNSRRLVLAHRWIYEQVVGHIPNGYQIDHLCRTTLCVRPSHLEPVTPRENTHRSTAITATQARQTACLRGHPFDASNTYRYKDRRICRACVNLRSATYRDRASMKGSVLT
jgi:hypothetical protein